MLSPSFVKLSKSSLLLDLVFYSPFFFVDQEKMRLLADEEKALREENIRLQRRLLREMERREALSRQLSESESSLEMEDERRVFKDFSRNENDQLFL